MTAQPDNVLDFDAHAAKPEAKIVFVNPDIAARWLERNTHNRNIRPSVVRKYARDMAAGNWQITGEGVKFAPDGALLDGQHRLAAVIESGATVPLLVVRGIQPAAQQVMDTGRARTASDALALRGEHHTATLAATARVALALQADADLNRFEPTHAEVAAFVDANPDLREAVETTKALARRTDCPPAIVAYAYWQMAQIDRQAAADFWVAAADKVGLTAGDPVIAMTNRFAEVRRNRERFHRRAYLSVIYRAWNYRRGGKTWKRARVNSPAGGIVPIPELT